MAKNDIIYYGNNNNFYVPFDGVPSNAALKSFAATEDVYEGVTPSVSISSKGLNVSLCFGKRVERKVVYEFK